MPSDYENAHAKYRELAAKARSGDAQAHADKAKAMNEIRNIERAAAKSGTILNMTPTGVVQKQQVRSKQSLQEEYVHKFDDKNVVDVGGKPQTLRQFHSKRLLGR